MKFEILLPLCILSLRKECQSLKPTRTYNSVPSNSGQLYFHDNMPANLNTNNANLRGDVQQSTQQTQTQAAADSYLKAHQIQQVTNEYGNEFKVLNKPANQNLNANQNQNQYPYNNLYLNQNQNGNYQFQPSLEILPPVHSSPEYYATRQNVQSEQEISADNRFSAKVDPAPQTKGNATTQEMKLASFVMSHIGIFMLKSVRGNEGNVVVSPLSVVNMLALLQAGATGETQRQISDALQLTPEMSKTAFQIMNTELRKRGAQRNVLRSASSVFTADSFELSNAFKNTAIQDFDSEVSRISFENPNLAAKKINSWIANKTNNKIDKLVSPDSIGINTQLVLANAVYFKGLWETMFKPESTTKKDFRLSNGEIKSVPFMSLRSGFRCGLDESINALVAVLPFESKQYSLVMLLPERNANVKEVLSTLSGEKLADYQNIRLQDVLLEIPKFTVRANTDLQPILRKMGITKLFTAASDLNNIGLYGATPPQVSSAVHSAMMSVDERGATAAASTVVAVVALSYDNPSIVFRADRPFLAVLWDNQLNAPLFMTQIEDPAL